MKSSKQYTSVSNVLELVNSDDNVSRHQLPKTTSNSNNSDVVSDMSEKHRF